MRRQVTALATAGAMAVLLGVGSMPAAAASTSPTLHSATARLAGSVNVAALPKVSGHASGGSARQLPLRSRPGNAPGTAAGVSTASPRSSFLSIGLGTQLTPALADSDNTSPLTPPDMGIGADATHVVQMVNVVGKMWTSGVAGAAFQLNSFFLAGSDFTSDPWVLYDQESGRWFAGIFDVTGGGERFAISQTGNPTGSWFVYMIQYPGVAGGGCPDQGKGGVDSNVVALGFNEFSGAGCAGGSFLGAGLEIFNKAQMMAGASVNFSYTNPIASYFSLIPAQALSSGQTTEYFASNDLNSTSKALHRVTSTGVPGVSTVTLTALADLTLSHTYPAPPAAKQPGTTVKLASGDQRTQHVVWKAGVGLLLTWTEACIPAGDTAQRDCGRVIATNDGVGGPAVTMDSDVSKKGKNDVYPAATLNSSNDVVVTFGLVSGTTNPQLDVTVATVGGAFVTPKVLVAGTAANTTKRYGDYFAVALDPGGTTPNRNVWCAGEIGGPVASDWQTAVREVKVTP